MLHEAHSTMRVVAAVIDVAAKRCVAARAFLWKAVKRGTPGVGFSIG
jgi:hypothetical protein